MELPEYSRKGTGATAAAHGDVELVVCGHLDGLVSFVVRFRFRFESKDEDVGMAGSC